jgi:hypothetical protein
MAAAHTYTKLNDSFATKLVDLNTDTFAVLLLDGYTPGQDTHQFVSDVLAAGTEVVGTGYARQNLTGVSVSDTGHVTTMTCDSPAWPGSTFSATHAVFYDNTPTTDATRPVLCFWDFGGTENPAGITFTLTLDTAGLLQLIGS